RYIPGSYSASTDFPLPGPGVLPTTDTQPGFTVSAGTGTCASNRDMVQVTAGNQNIGAQAVTITVHFSVAITGLDRNNVHVFTSVAAAGHLPPPNRLRPLTNHSHI